ncbi:unnamed protein product [Parnassius mnemosyne]|uniref:Uncharacterized protein n=1 Tax=Parnassius mnemosyne TaxID=213953 RepID=A0AAV1LA62_9NEOP
MQNPSRKKLLELQTIMSKMSFELCTITVFSEFGVRWRDVARAVRNARLPMTPSNIARIVCKGVAKNLPAEEVDEIISKLRLKLVATQSRIWYVIDLKEPLSEEPVEETELPERLMQALISTRIGRNKTPEIQTVRLGDLVFASVQLSSDTRSSAPLYLAIIPGAPVALTSSVRPGGLLKACVLGLGYESFVDASLHGRDIPSLLRIHAGWSENADHLKEIPEYDPVPVLTKTGIDYTNKMYDEQYVDNILGPDPPLLTDLCIKSSKMFFDPQRLNKPMNLTMQLKSEDVAKTLKSWVMIGAVAPTSDFFQIFNKLKSNKITYTAEE